MKEGLTGGDVVVVEDFREPLLGHGHLGVLHTSLCDEVVVGLITCGRVLFGQGPSRALVLVHNNKEDEGEKQKEVRESQGSEEIESEVDREVGEKITQRARETW